MNESKEMPVSYPDLLRPKTVVEKVQQRLGNPKIRFTLDTHTRCWKKYKVRPPENSLNPRETRREFCLYDSLYEGYGYTQEWVDFLIKELKDEENFKSLYAESGGVVKQRPAR